MLDDMLEGVRRKARTVARPCSTAATGTSSSRSSVSRTVAATSSGRCTTRRTRGTTRTSGVALGGDPVRTIYSAVDAELGDLLEHVGDDTTVYVHLSHGMRSHYDGTCILDPVLWRLDEYASGHDQRGASHAPSTSRRTRCRARRADRRSPRCSTSRRRIASRSGPIGTDGRAVDLPEWVGERRWWMQPNDSVYGSVR